MDSHRAGPGRARARRLIRAGWVVLALAAGMSVPMKALDVQVDVSPLRELPACSGQFVAHDLDHVTTVPHGDRVRMFEANGAGVGINDLDNDGDLDIVLANHAGQNSILWNEGAGVFRTERMDTRASRGVTLIDFDGDGWTDLFFTRVASAPNLWRSQHDGTFRREVLNRVAEPLYATGWADLDGDGDLDLVGGTYDAELLTELGNDFLMSGRGGVYVYERSGDRLIPTRLAGEAQALALLLTDVNGDGRLDILIGNDFAVPDNAWLRTEVGWEAAAPFTATSYSTMSLDAADVDNDGRDEVFSTDMKPFEDSAATRAAWEPILSGLPNTTPKLDNPQVSANVLEVAEGGAFRNEAPERGLDATGWSWSGKFGDLDRDGFLDLYVVNGMIEFTTFAHLPDHELVEENQALRNDGRGFFVPAPEWNLRSSRSGRGMSMADLDGDGDLDIVVNNLRGAAQWFENQICGGESLLVDLRWPDSGNTRAVGARLKLQTDQGTFTREVRASSGYLSGDPSQIHFGFPAGTILTTLDIIWPDGTHTQLESLTPHTRVTVTR
ncbi:MAG: CRTAC1 family protein [Anaerolineae bacterium]|nr:CRTAC1 family protein [Anaerolineae bacterium]